MAATDVERVKAGAGSSRVSSGPGSSAGSLSNGRPSKPHQGNAGVATFTTRAPKTMTLINNQSTKKQSITGFI